MTSSLDSNRDILACGASQFARRTFSQYASQIACPRTKISSILIATSCAEDFFISPSTTINMTNYSHILAYYGEIGLKGKNRGMFEQQLVNTIKHSDVAHFFISVKRISGRILIELHASADSDAIIRALSRIYGIVYVMPVVECEQTFDSLAQTTRQLARESVFESFAIRARRQNHDFILSSSDMEKMLGGVVLDLFPHARVDLTNPDITFYVVIVEDFAFVGCQKIQGFGGLPVGISGRVLVLLSGGIDSPVAASMLQKRGCPVDFIHFHNAPYTSDASREKAVNLARMLAKFQDGARLFLVAFTDIQKEIVKHCDQKYRVLLYRRAMLRMAREVAQKNRINALATGDNIAQVASQTIENLVAVNHATDMLILRPLLGLDKQEIIDRARVLGTYEESIMPHDDCCSYFMPRQPETHATVRALELEESKLSMVEIWQTTLDSIEEIRL